MCPPVDYISPLLQAQINPAQAFSEGMTVGNGLVANQRATVADQREGLVFAQGQQDRTAAIEAAKAQALAQAKKAVAYQDDLDALKSDGSTQAYLDFAKAHPEATEVMIKQHEAATKEVKQRRLEQSVRTKALLSHGQKSTAVDLLQRDANALEESDPKEAEILRRQAQSIDDDDVDAMGQADLWLSAVAPKEFAEVNEKLSVQPGVIAKSRADAKKAEADAEVAAVNAVNAEVDKMIEQGTKREVANKIAMETKKISNNMGLEWAQLAREVAKDKREGEAALKAAGELTAGQVSAINDSTRGIAVPRLGAVNNAALAAKFRAIKTGGSGAKVEEFIKKQWGEGGEVTAARRQFNIVKNGLVLTMLPPGSASEKDVELISAGFPESTDNPEDVANFLDALANVQRAEEKMKRAENQWLTQNKANLGNARAPISVMGIPVEQGTSFDDFIVKNGAAITKDITTPTPAIDPAAAAANDALFGVSK